MHGAVHKVRHTHHVWLPHELSHGALVVEKLSKLRANRVKERALEN